MRRRTGADAKAAAIVSRERAVQRVARSILAPLVPLFGFWLASSLAAYKNTSQWLALDKPLGAGEFARQPLLSSYIGTLGVALDEPTRSQITVDDGEATIVLDNPYHAALMADLETHHNCKPEELGTKTKLVCEVPAGKHEIRMYGARDRNAHHLDYIGSILVNSR